MSSGGNFRYYDFPFTKGLGICRDSQGYECAQLEPALFPEVPQNPRKEKGYEFPKSPWGKLPSEGRSMGYKLSSLAPMTVFQDSAV